MIFYSPVTKGFYTLAVHGKKIPEGCVEITKAEHRALMEEQCQGKEIHVVEGKPTAVLPIEIEEEVNANRILVLKELLSDSDYKVLPDYDKENETIIAQRKLWREEIRMLKGK